MLTSHRPLRSAVAALLILLSALAPAASATVTETPELPRWTWPLEGPRSVAEPFRAPAHEFGAGHRGVDLASAVSATVIAPADGTVAFRGTVVDRPLLTIEHDGGLVSTFEPVSSSLEPGDPVSAGERIGAVDVGGHAPHGTLHVGARLDGEYINPMLLFGAVPRAILLPCCGGGEQDSGYAPAFTLSGEPGDTSP